MKEASLYTALRRLEKGGFITSYWGDETLGGRRKYYRITQKGLERYLRDREDWVVAKDILTQLIEGGGHGGRGAEAEN